MDNQYRKSGKLSLRNSIMVWIGGAVLGWALMVVSIYNVLRFPTDQLAENELAPPPGIMATDDNSLNKIAPAAGDISPDAATTAEDASATEDDAATAAKALEEITDDNDETAEESKEEEKEENQEEEDEDEAEPPQPTP